MTQTVDASRTLYAANHERVRRILARLVGQQEAEDLTQTVFAKAAKTLPTFRGDADTSTWLHRIAANVASDWLHSRSTHEAKVTVPLPGQSDDDTGVAALGSTDVDGGPSAEKLLSNKEIRDCIRREIGKLPETLRNVFMLSALGGLTDEEIGRTLGISHNNTKVRLHRARQEFKKIIEARCDFAPLLRICLEDGRIAFTQKPQDDLRGVRSHQIDFMHRDCERLFKHGERMIETTSNLFANRLHNSVTRQW